MKKSNACQHVLTYEELALPVVLVAVVEAALESDGEVDVALGLDERLDADGPVRVDHRPSDYLRVEATLDDVVGPETGSRDVDDRTTKHVAALGREDQWQVGPSCNFLYITSTACMLVLYFIVHIKVKIINNSLF